MSNYVCAVGDKMPSDPNEPVMDLLLQQYKRVIMESLITSFGLDFLVQDQYGGDVDTIHNVRQVGQVPDEPFPQKRTQNKRKKPNKNAEIKSAAIRRRKRQVQPQSVQANASQGQNEDEWCCKRLRGRQIHRPVQLPL